MQTERLAPAMGVRLGGIDLRIATSDLVGELRELLNEHHLVCVANQDLHEEEQHIFGSLWGELLTHPTSLKRANPYVQLLAGSGQAKHRVFGSWHSDMTWHPTPPWITMLHARKIPSFGGDTGYANQHMAWEHLEQARKDQRRSHRRYLPTADSLLPQRANHTGKGFGPEVPDSVHPVVRTHNENGKQALYVNPEFTTHIVGVEENDSLRTLFPLWMHAITEEFVYRHQWHLGDLVIWDNRSVMHTAILDYDEPRAMQRVVVKGDTPT
ncbi:MAG: TauD/TfdA family dioxygenase [Gammaproteobacteria bacterium]|nr:TauD/TfdA family dioxygenase [Gammaproteobacteria bacterium]